jgi:hypothetical protein
LSSHHYASTHLDNLVKSYDPFYMVRAYIIGRLFVYTTPVSPSRA